MSEPAALFRRRRGGGRLRLVAVLLLACVAWLVGLVGFVDGIPREPAEGGGSADGIVVLTGGGRRVEVGLALLLQDRGQRLLISGVHADVRREDLLAFGPPRLSGVLERIDLGFEAVDTVTNAREIAAWARRHGWRSLRVVTSNYHMRRSLAEIAHALPGVRLVPHPVIPEDLHVDEWWRWPRSAWLLAGEYLKWQVSSLRILRDRLVGAAA